MSTEPQRTCPSCGNELSGATEFCPVCLLRKGLADGVESGGSSASEDPVEPKTPEEGMQRFEHYELVTGEDGQPVELGRGAMHRSATQLDRLAVFARHQLVVLKSLHPLFRCFRLDWILGSRRPAGFNPVGKTLSQQADRTELRRSRKLVATAR